MRLGRTAAVSLENKTQTLNFLQPWHLLELWDQTAFVVCAHDQFAVGSGELERRLRFRGSLGTTAGRHSRSVSAGWQLCLYRGRSSRADGFWQVWQQFTAVGYCTCAELVVSKETPIRGRVEPGGEESRGLDARDPVSSRVFARWFKDSCLPSDSTSWNRNAENKIWSAWRHATSRKNRWMWKASLLNLALKYRYYVIAIFNYGTF